MAETSDPILREIEEDLREERLASLWKRFGPLLVGGAVVLVAGVAAFQIWSGQQHDTNLATGRQFDAAQELVLAGNGSAAAEVFQEIAADGPDGYALLARFRIAQLSAADGDTDTARATLRSIANDAAVDSVYRDVAILRAALLGLDAGVNADTLIAELAPLVSGTGPWRFLAREATALAELNAGDRSGAKSRLDALVADAETPPGIRSRASAIADALAETES